jgi:hypothetical protein
MLVRSAAGAGAGTEEESRAGDELEGARDEEEDAEEDCGIRRLLALMLLVLPVRIGVVGDVTVKGRLHSSMPLLLNGLGLRNDCGVCERLVISAQRRTRAAAQADENTDGATAVERCSNSREWQRQQVGMSRAR